MSSSSEAKARVQARNIRKGTHSCWECRPDTFRENIQARLLIFFRGRRRKIRCQFSSPGDLVCRPCRNRGSICRGQEVADESEASQLSMRHLARRLGRLEELMEKLAERSVLSSSTGISAQDSPEFSPVRIDELGNLQAPMPKGQVRPGIPTVSSSHDTTSSLLSSATDETSIDLVGDLGIAERLYKLFPSQSDVDAILEASIGHVYVTTLFHRQADVAEGNSEPPEAIGAVPSPSSRPTLLAKRLLQLVICMQQLSPRFNTPLHSVCTSIVRTMENIVDGVDKFISANRVVSTLEGLECLFLLGYWQQNAGNLRKAWLIFRQALSVGQLMGINTATVAPRNTSFSNQYPPSPDMLWFRSVACDRYLSLLLGLPAGSHDNSFAGQPQTARDAPSEKLDKLHAVLSEKMIERNNSTQTEAYRLTQLISSDLLAGQGLMGDAWWELPLVDTGQSPSSTFEVAGRMILQMSHHLLLVLLHIPYMLRNPLFPHDQQSSKMICTSSSRTVLERFRVFRSFNDSAHACRHVDYAALVAAMTLLVSHAQHLEDHPTNDDYLHRSADRTLITTVRDRMKDLAYLNSDKFFEESTNVIDQLLPLLNSSDAESPTFGSQHSSGVELHIPYFGTIKIAVPPVSTSASKTPAMQSVATSTPHIDGPEINDLEPLVPVHFHPQDQRNSFSAADITAGADAWAMQGIDATYWALLQMQWNP
ncbi:C6 zinc finger domain protein [Fusarium sp. NRRL 52700]|nr:C6 zinc finger domain protein [Fusarium sp. NRRL 52700]